MVSGKDKVCASCGAWLPPDPKSPDKTMGQCRLNPPTAFVVQTQVGKIMSPGQQPQIVPAVISAWPPCPASGGCWQWKADEGEKA